MPPADIGSFALLASIWPWLSLGTGDEDCFRGQPWLSYETCCQDKSQEELCWGVDAEDVGEYCCGRDVRPGARSLFAAELWNLVGHIILEVQSAVDCELATWQDGTSYRCERLCWPGWLSWTLLTLSGSSMYGFPPCIEGPAGLLSKGFTLPCSYAKHFYIGELQQS